MPACRSDAPPDPRSQPPPRQPSPAGKTARTWLGALALAGHANTQEMLRRPVQQDTHQHTAESDIHIGRLSQRGRDHQMNTSRPRASVPPPTLAQKPRGCDASSPVTIPNAFAPIVVGPCGVAPAAAGVAAPPYPLENTDAPSPVLTVSPAIGLQLRETLDEGPGGHDLPDDRVQRHRRGGAGGVVVPPRVTG